MLNDPFSDLLRLMSARSVFSGGLIAGGAWSVRSPATDKVKFSCAVRGSCWLQPEGETSPIRLEEGDVFLMTEPRSLVIASDLTVVPTDLSDVLDARERAMCHLGEGDDFYMIGGKVELHAASGRLLLDELPAFIHIRANSPQMAALHVFLRQMLREREENPPGAEVASAQLAHLMFIQILRACLEQVGVLSAGWLRAAGDRRLSPAIRLMHDNPARAWRLEELAKAALMSRAAFAACFKSVAGVSPMAYLTAWRMRLAERALLESRTSISVLAQSLGYASESAFSHAFRRVIGTSPTSYRNASQASARSDSR